MSISVKIINQSVHPLPAYATPDAAGMDLRANIPSAIILQPLERQLIPTVYLLNFHRDMKPR